MRAHRARFPRRRRWGWPTRILLAGLTGAVALLAVWPLYADAAGRPGGAVVIPIRGEISDVMKESIQRRMDQALAGGAKTIIFEMDTPGGLVISALGICDLIKGVPDDVHTVAWVHPKAFSAGAMISVSCKQILMSKRSSIGDCAPIMVSPMGGLEGLPPAERAKAESPILEEFRDSAIRNGYNPLLCRAMVTTGEEVWWIQQIDTGERKFVDAAEKAKLVDEPEQGTAKWRLVETYHDAVSGKDVPAHQPVDKADELLTLRQSEAVAYGFATAIASDLDAVAETLDLSVAPGYDDITGWEQFVMWLNSPIVRGILFVIVLIGAYMEFQHPGLILPGVTAAVALIIFLAAPYAAGLANVWTFILLGIGLILLGIELFLVPGHGVSGLIGAALILIAIIGTFLPAEPGPSKLPFFHWPQLPGTWEYLQKGIIYLSSSVIVAFVGILLILRFLPQLRVVQRLIPDNPEGATLALTDPFRGAAQIGELGVVTGDLRPGGQARFGQDVVDVQSQGEYVEAGRRVQVIRREGMQIVVRPLPEDSAT